MTIGAWIGKQRNIYFGNASSVREFRTQLRGNRAIFTFTGALVLLIIVSMAFYQGVTANRALQIAEVQSSLTAFYMSLIGLLETMIAAIAPVIVGMSIAAEQRKGTLERIFAAPVEAKYYLVGKMLSGYRVVWLLLALSLPIVASCVVLGGTTWGEVLKTYVLLSAHALLFMALTLPIATQTSNPTSLALWSYAAIGAYMYFTSSLALVTAMGPMMGPTGATNELPFFVAMAPYFGAFVVDSHTTIFGLEVENWIIACLVILMITKLMVLATASAMSGYGAKETVSLRIHALIYSFLGAFIIMFSLRPGLGVGMSGPGAEQAGAATILLLCALLIPALPSIACYAPFAPRRRWPTGLWSWRGALHATADGGLPFLLAYVAAASLGVILAATPGPSFLGPTFWAYLFWIFAMCLLVWALARWCSSHAFGEIAASHRGFVLGMVLIFAVPLPLLTVIGMILEAKSFNAESILRLYPLSPIGYDELAQPLAMGGVLLLIAVFLVVQSEKSRISKQGLKT